MDPFVRRLVQRLHDPSQPLSRNRHFHTFDNPQGRAALKLSRRLKALQKDLVTCQAEGGKAVAQARPDGLQIELTLQRLHARRVTRLEAAEYELLCALPGVREAIE